MNLIGKNVTFSSDTHPQFRSPTRHAGSVINPTGDDAEHLKHT